MTEMGSAGTLGDLLASRRRRRFVGRASEVELFRAALESPEPPFVVLHIHGPPGIGKTRLLDAFAGLAAGAGASVVRLDGRDLLPSPPAVLQALGGALELPGGRAPSPGWPTAAGWWSWSTPMSGWGRWMTGCAPGCCRGCRPPP